MKSQRLAKISNMKRNNNKKIKDKKINKNKIKNSKRKRNGKKNIKPVQDTEMPKRSGFINYVKTLLPCCRSNSTVSKPRKAKIPLAMRQSTWVDYFGKVYEHKCYTKWCHRFITVFDFEVGHNIPESKGGKTHPSNLRPICRQCNIGMGNRYTVEEWSRLGGNK